ncbi:hypothetical protein E0H36_17695 [Rhizobium leguminosarum bv. viciae]|nr:hypothetical protein BS629_26535 [Rhizobium leguminosarum bv. viciae USDA 2370]TBZ31100.1 hypothetical protein E0H36_17695 [Rhizobium leguminosarum bv. viciae]PUB64878.1 hypothetical protein DB728_09165 [Rhizobium leguminosarum bv. viciae USDA 2370]TBZ50666.1 hypothetical protein E0H42_20670 [Rhizobium leguminosarum bv. viciae]TBZ52154.1 hypothetical protein E0H44_04990 [Rhizobium leguminosarum bv. viciae]
MIFSASAIGLKLFGLVSLAFHRRPEATSTEASENVVVSLLLDEWCRHSATNRNDPNAYGCPFRASSAVRPDPRTSSRCWTHMAPSTSP